MLVSGCCGVGGKGFGGRNLGVCFSFYSGGVGVWIDFFIKIFFSKKGDFI